MIEPSHPATPGVEPQITCHLDAGRGWRIHLRGEIDVTTDPELATTLAAVTAADSADILVDLTEVTFLASTGLGFLAQLRNHADTGGHAVTLHGPDRAARRALTLMGFDHVFTITD